MPKVELQTWMDEFNYYKISYYIGEERALVTTKEFLNQHDLRQFAADLIDAADVIARQPVPDFDESDAEVHTA